MAHCLIKCLGLKHCTDFLQYRHIERFSYQFIIHTPCIGTMHLHDFFTNKSIKLLVEYNGSKQIAHCFTGLVLISYKKTNI
jgi:hypothetical protein